jgi:hypothetical protein
MEKGYGRWLAWLDSKDLLDAKVAQYTGPGKSVRWRFRKDWSWIYRRVSAIRARQKPARPKRHRLVPIEKLFAIGLDLMAGADTETSALRRFKIYRDGLLIAALASRQLRLRNLTGLILDRTLAQRGNGWWIQIPAAETKRKDPIIATLVAAQSRHRCGLTACPNFFARTRDNANVDRVIAHR